MKYELTINQPCNQSLSNMISCKSGHFCQRCDKPIIDFRELSDEKIAETHLNSEVIVCGIYKNNQVKVKQPIIQYQKNIPKKWFVVSLGLLGFIFPKDINGATVLNFKGIQIAEKVLNQKQVFELRDSIPNKEKYLVHGILRNKSGDTVIGVSCYIKNTKIGVLSDLDGKYKIDLTQHLIDSNKVVLVYEYTGYKTIEKEFRIGKKQEVNLVLEVDKELLEEVIVIGYGNYRNLPPKKLTFWEKVKNLFKRKSKGK